jgi:hypothetical protein
MMLKDLVRPKPKCKGLLIYIYIYMLLALKLWDPTTGELQQTLEGHSDWVWSEANLGVSILENQWLCFRSERILWLPLEYRPIRLALKDGILSLGHVSGRFSFISVTFHLISAYKTSCHSLLYILISFRKEGLEWLGNLYFSFLIVECARYFSILYGLG